MYEQFYIRRNNLDCQVVWSVREAQDHLGGLRRHADSAGSSGNQSIIAVLITGILIKNSILVSITPLLLAVAHAWRNNTMMEYVERNAYDGTGN